MKSTISNVLHNYSHLIGPSRDGISTLNQEIVIEKKNVRKDSLDSRADASSTSKDEIQITIPKRDSVPDDGIETGNTPNQQLKFTQSMMDPTLAGIDTSKLTNEKKKNSLYGWSLIHDHPLGFTLGGQHESQKEASSTNGSPNLNQLKNFSKGQHILAI